MSQITRNSKKKLENLLSLFPVVALIGARQTGKTVLSQSVRPKWQYLDLENPDDYQLISQNPTLYFEQFDNNIIFDEAQCYPELFKILRGIIDKKRNKKGRFIITGSSSPTLLNQLSDSLAGRIAIIEINTLKANEYYQTPLSDFYDLFKQPLTKQNVNFNPPLLCNQQLRDHWLKGGYPEPRINMKSNEQSLWMQNYMGTYINRDVAALFPKLNKVKFQRFISMLAQLSGTIINKSDLGRTLECHESTARDYLSIADNTFIWRELLSYEQSSIKSVLKMPKGHLRDSGLLNYLLRVGDHEQMLKSIHIGRAFESFVIEEIIKGLQSTLLTNWQTYYYRTRGGAEVDLIIEGSFGTLPIEIKYGSSTPLKQLTSLNNFIEQNNLTFGLLINQSSRALWLNDKIYQLPVCYL